jgi:uncharacterized lipoprotein YmbA
MKFITDIGRVVPPTLAAGCLLTLLAGCGTFQPVQDVTRFYTLGGATASERIGAVPAPNAPLVGVRIVQTASHLRRPGMVVRVSEHELRYAAGHRWAERLDDAVARDLAAGVQRQVGSRVAVAVAPALRAPVPDVLVEVELLQCEGRAGANGAAVFAADWRIVGGKPGKPLSAGRFQVEKAGWNGTDYDQLAALLSAALDDFAAALAPQVTAVVSAP